MSEPVAHTEAVEMIAIAGKILELASANIACSQEVLIGALKIAANAVDELRNADMAAQVRAAILHQSRRGFGR